MKSVELIWKPQDVEFWRWEILEEDSYTIDEKQWRNVLDQHEDESEETKTYSNDETTQDE